MADEKKSTIVNIIALVLIVIVNVTISFFVLKYMLQKTQNSIIEKQSEILAAEQQKQEDLIRPKKIETKDEEVLLDENGEKIEEDIDEFEGYDPQMFINYPLEDIYANTEGRFVVITMQLKYAKENEKKLGPLLDNALPDIRANILSLLRRESIVDLEDVKYTKKLRAKIKARINSVLQNENQELGIEYVLFTQFIIE